MAESLTQGLANGAVSLGSDRTVRLVGFVAFVVMALFMVLRIGILPAASAGDDVWYDESGYWLLNAGFCFAAALIVLVLRGFYRRLLARENAEDDGALPPKEEVAMDPAVAGALD